jgi:hypothetical protein
VTLYKLDGPWIESRWEARDSAAVQTGPGAHQVSCTMSLSRVQSGRGVALTTHPPLAPTLKKEYSCASTPALGLHGLSYGKTRHYMEVVSFKTRSLYPRGKNPLKKKLDEVPDPAWTLQRIAQNLLSPPCIEPPFCVCTPRGRHYAGYPTPRLLSAQLNYTPVYLAD